MGLYKEEEEDGDEFESEETWKKKFRFGWGRKEKKIMDGFS